VEAWGIEPPEKAEKLRDHFHPVTKEKKKKKKYL